MYWMGDFISIERVSLEHCTKTGHKNADCLSGVIAQSAKCIFFKNNPLPAIQDNCHLRSLLLMYFGGLYCKLSDQDSMFVFRDEISL